VPPDSIAARDVQQAKMLHIPFLVFIKRTNFKRTVYTMPILFWLQQAGSVFIFCSMAARCPPFRAFMDGRR